MKIHWYPGHMTKAKRLVENTLKWIDVVVELADARAPLSTRNPEWDKLFQYKRRLLILNKSDLADASVTAAWQKYFKQQQMDIIVVDALKRNEVKSTLIQIEKQVREKTQGLLEKKGLRKVVRAMVVGIPNVGKSSFINSAAGRKPAKTEDRPGVTRGLQWINISPYLDLLDMPGMLWPRQDNEDVARKLAFLGSIPDDIMDKFELSCLLIQQLKETYPHLLKQRYKLSVLENEPEDILKQICVSRGFLISGGEPDVLRAAVTVLDEFRDAKIGRISLENPPAEGQTCD